VIDLKSDKIFLRAIEPEDVDTLFIWENDLANWRVSGTKAPFTRNLLLEFAQSPQDIFMYKQIRFMICENESNRSLGTIDLFDYDPINRSVGVGILIQGSSDKGKGYATDALNLVQKYGKEVLDLRNIFASMHESNEISVKLFEKCKYQKVGTKKMNLFSNGIWENELIYQLIIE
jgi:diamine N-acetyltransferase